MRFFPAAPLLFAALAASGHELGVTIPRFEGELPPVQPWSDSRGRTVDGPPRFKIKCGTGKHTPKTFGANDGPFGSESTEPLMSVEEERVLIEEAMTSLYPDLPPDLKEIAERVTFLADHADDGLGVLYVGWSAEDDPDYKYPDKGFYPEGTIKVNLASRFIAALHAHKRMEKSPPPKRPDGKKNGFDEMLENSRAMIRGTFVHELVHARQYHEKPLRDLLREPKCPEGLCDLELIASTKDKLDYEKEAYEIASKFNPKSVWNAEKVLSYSTQFGPPEVARRLKLLNDHPSERASLDLKSLRKLWLSYRNQAVTKDNPGYGHHKKAYSYLEAVEARIAAELEFAALPRKNRR